MKRKNLYPMERNNYFYGKLLTVRDFDDEQRYNNNKRRINNVLTKGCGVVSGLSVLVIDDKIISVEAGMALDYQGREIIVEEGVSKKLNVIEGFNEIKDYDNVYLCIAYDESMNEEVHSITGGGKDGNNHNRIKEGYRLFLTNYVNENAIHSARDILNIKKAIYNENGLKITHIAPAYVRDGEVFEFIVEIEKNNLPRAISLDYSIAMAGMRSENGENSINVSFSDEDLSAYKKVRLSYKMIADKENADSGRIYFDKGSVKIETQEYKVSKAEADSECVIKLYDSCINDAIVASYLEEKFYNVLEKNFDNNIYLAKFRLIKNEDNYLIDAFEVLPYNQYVVSNDMLYALISRNTSCTMRVNSGAEGGAVAMPKESGRKEEKFLASGTEEIESELRNKGKSYFSAEISHGLGNGDVFIYCALEENADKENYYDTRKNYMGDLSVFDKSIFEGDIPNVKIGVITYPDKGTFRIGIKHLSDTDELITKVKWWAVKNDKKRKNDYTDIDGINISISPDTITLHSREKVKFEAIVKGTHIKECKWSVTEKEGGSIDANGLYEAPTKEGVYEIVAQSTAYPNKKATAFVVVRD